MNETNAGAESADWPLVLEWAEKAAVENLRQRVESGALLAKAAETTLTVLLAGMGAALAYAVRLFEPASGPVAGGAAWVCGYLAVLATWLVITCMLARGAPAVHNEPKNLLERGMSLAQLREAELLGMQVRIERWTARNARAARMLNAVRLAAAATPLVFVLAALHAR